MANRKEKLRQVRRRKQNFIKAASAVAATAAVCILVFFVFMYFKNKSANGDARQSSDVGKTPVAKIGGVEITEAEFAMYLIEQVYSIEQSVGSGVWDETFENGETTENLAKQQTLEKIRKLKECSRRAIEEGLAADSDEIAQITSFVENQDQNALVPAALTRDYGIDKNTLKIFLTDSFYYQRVFEEYTRDFAPPPEYEKDSAAFIEQVTEYQKTQAEQNSDAEPLTEERLAQIAANAKETYLNQLKKEYFEKILTPWVENIPIEVDEAALSSITVAKVKAAANGL